MTVTAIIADDEPLLRLELRKEILDLWPELNICAEVDDGAAALRAIDELSPTICFLDIRMPKLTGIEVAERIQGSVQVVFVTAYDEHAIAAFEQGAIDYLLKPIKRARLAGTIQRLRLRIERVPHHRISSGPWLNRIQATCGNTLRFIPASDILFCRSEGKYTSIVTASSTFLIRRSLSALLQDLDPDSFWQIHRGTVVNVGKIESVVRQDLGTMVVRVRGTDKVLPVSKPNQSLFRGM